MTNSFQLRLFVGWICAALLTFALVCGCSNEESRQGDPSTKPAVPMATLRLAYRPRALTDVTPVVLAETTSIGKTVRIQLIPVATAQEGFARLNAGEADALAGMPLEATFAQMTSASGAFKYRAYAASVDTKGAGWVAIVASKESGATKITDLADKTVASLPTDQANWLLRRILKKSGVAVDPMKVVRYSPVNPIAGLRSGEHAAIFGPEPGNAMAIAEGGVVIARGPISELLYGGRPVPITASLVSEEFVKQHPEAFREFLDLIDGALEVVNKNPEQVRGYFGREKYGGLSGEVVKRIELPNMLRPTPEVAAVAREFVADLVADGLLKQAVDSDRLFLADK